jgi:hypothetical protein
LYLCLSTSIPAPLHIPHPAGSIKKEEPVALVRIIPHATSPNNILFLGAGSYIW